MATNYVCNVYTTGVTVLHSDTPAPEVLLQLSDTNSTPAFTNTWFFAAEGAQNQMLAVALAAISTLSTVSAWVDPPITGKFTQCYELSIVA
ncbi:MAG: hypothetical protein WBP71_12775 [Terracidiphilus sp.]